MSDIGTLFDSGFITATDINNTGQIVGENSLPGQNTSHAFLYSDGVMTDLNLLPEIQEAGWSFLRTASSINDHGQVVGAGFISGEDHAFLLTPIGEIPEPSIALLMLAGVLGMGGTALLRKP